MSHEGFLHQSLPLGHSRPFHRSTISFMSVSLLSPSSGDYRSQISWMAGTVWRIHSSCFSYHVSYISFEFHFQLYGFLFLGCPFIFTGHFSLSIIRFCKIHHDYHRETGDNTKANLLSGCGQMDRLLKEMVQLITTKAHLIFIWWSVH